MVLDKFRRLIEKSGYQISSKLLLSMLPPYLSALEVPHASVYVIDGLATRQSIDPLLGNILSKDENAGLLVIGDKFTEADIYSMLRLGVKGILSYEEAHEQLSGALSLVAAGGFWPTRAVLSHVTYTFLGSTQKHRHRVNRSAQLSTREQEVLILLLDALRNKELADRLHITERTVKFHVSNILFKFGVARRSELILLNQRSSEISTQPQSAGV